MVTATMSSIKLNALSDRRDLRGLFCTRKWDRNLIFLYSGELHRVRQGGISRSAGVGFLRPAKKNAPNNGAIRNWGIDLSTTLG